MATDPDELLTPDDVSRLLQVPKSTIYGWRLRGEGPEGFRVGRHLRYRRGDMNAWVEKRKIEERKKAS